MIPCLKKTDPILIICVGWSLQNVLSVMAKFTPTYRPEAASLRQQTQYDFLFSHFSVESMLRMAERSMYESRMQEIVREFPCVVATGATQLTDYLYIGGYNEARNMELLAGLGITHVLNCAAYRKSLRNPYPEWTGIIGYRQFEASDDDFYDIIQHVPASKSFIDGARSQGGKVFVHCARGINRSGAICIAYMTVDQQQDMMEVVQYVKRRRGVILSNGSFRRQLIDFARKYGLLSSSKDSQSHHHQNLNYQPTKQVDHSGEITKLQSGRKRSNLNVVLQIPKTWRYWLLETIKLEIKFLTAF